jgi:probable selenium-dependent hydroxylase accessory protein YqeC
VNYFFLEHWHEFLPREAGHVISLMGSGGKTSLMRAMADVLVAESLPVVMTTTTRTEPLEGVPVLDRKEIDPSETAGLPPVFFLREEILHDGKWAGLETEAIDDLGTLLPERIVLVEADGAAKMPLKIHRDDEPLWPGRTSLAVVVIGVDAVGSKVGDVVHRFGRQESPALAGHKDWTLVEWDHMAALILEDGGYLSRVPDGVPAVLAMTGLAGQDDSIGLFGFAGRAMEDPRLPLVILGDLGGEEVSLRTAVRDDDDSS